MLQALGLGNIARALRNPNFRIFTVGNAVSLIGTWMQRVVTGWLTWELTQSGFWLGAMAFADLFPTVVIGPFAGAYADRLDRLRVTQVSQILSLVQAVALLILTATGLINIWLLLALTLFLGIVAAFNQPARLALIPALVPRSDLAAAVAVNSIVFNLARFFGPAAAGLAIASVGIPLAYAVNAVTYVAFTIALSRIRLGPDEGPSGVHGGLLDDLVAGLRYTASHFGIATMLILMIAANIGSRPVIELLPGYAAEVFKGGPTELAILTSSIGAGAMVAGVWIGTRSGGLVQISLASTLISAVSAALFAACGSLWLALPFLTMTGFAMAAFGTSAQILIQGSVSADMRGRVLSIYGLIFRGGPAIGALLMGAASERVGLRPPVFVGALFLCAVWLWAWLRRKRLMDSLGQT
jgi:predicted MFS family arabinose efflux permease